MNVLVWNEHLHEQSDSAVQAVYPEGIHRAIADQLEAGLGRASISTATLADPEHGLTAQRLERTDVLIWWGHLGHHLVSGEVVARVHERVLQGMGLIVLHSGHLSKIFTRLMGTTCNLRWREAEDRELVWCVAPQHPIAAGVKQPLVIPRHEMYGEFFDIPVPDELVFISSFTGGEVFRSGCCFHRGKGRVFYFSPGHETYPVYHQPQIGQVLCNAVRWAAQPEIAAVETRRSPQSPTGWFEAD